MNSDTLHCYAMETPNEGINLNKPHGHQVTVTKEECASHVAKHLYKCLQYLCQKGAADKLGKKVLLSGKNGLTEKTTKKCDF